MHNLKSGWHVYTNLRGSAYMLNTQRKHSWYSNSRRNMVLARIQDLSAVSIVQKKNLMLLFHIFADINTCKHQE